MTEITPNLPFETRGTDITRFNALRHGILSHFAYEVALAGLREDTQAS